MVKIHFSQKVLETIMLETIMIYIFSNVRVKIGTIGRILMTNFKLLNTDDYSNDCKATCTNVSLGAATDIISVNLDYIYIPKKG